MQISPPDISSVSAISKLRAVLSSDLKRGVFQAFHDSFEVEKCRGHDNVKPTGHRSLVQRIDQFLDAFLGPVLKFVINSKARRVKNQLTIFQLPPINGFLAITDFPSFIVGPVDAIWIHCSVSLRCQIQARCNHSEEDGLWRIRRAKRQSNQ
jgi:hypothetical protein